VQNESSVQNKSSYKGFLPKAFIMDAKTEPTAIASETRKSSRFLVLLGLLLMTAAALFVHGYHPYAEDAEIYLPGIEQILHPQLFPMGREFFSSHANLTFFPNLIALSVRISHLPFDVVLLLWHVASIFLLLLACWQLASLCFTSARARWAAVGMVAALLTLPVAGTALYIMDQYLNPRNLAAFASVFAVARILESKYARAMAWLVFAAAVHPMMWAYPFSFCALLVVMRRFEAVIADKLAAEKYALVASCLLLQFPLNPASTPAYEEAARRHAFHYIQHWAWYEILGLVAPIALFWWFDRIAKKKKWMNVQRGCRGLIVYDIVYIVAALIIDLPARFETLARFQPLRSLQLLYIVMLVIGGGGLGEFVLKKQVWRWLALFLPISAGMFVAQRTLFPVSAIVEWPGVAPKNPWAQAFLWVRRNTPVDAIFALDPEYMHAPGEEEIGFRCLAQRSRMADNVKDNGVVSMFPPLAGEWWAQVQAQSPWESLTLEKFEGLKAKYGVDWILTQRSEVAGLDCRFQNSVVCVCRVP
jgi:hypothetical protein